MKRLLRLTAFIMSLIIVLPTVVWAQDDDEEITFPDYVYNNEDGYEYCQGLLGETNMWLYPENSEEEWLQDIAQGIAGHPDYESVKAWTKKRDNFRTQAQQFQKEADTYHAQGKLGPDGGLTLWYHRLEVFSREVMEEFWKYDEQYRYELASHEKLLGKWQNPLFEEELQDDETSTPYYFYLGKGGAQDCDFYSYRDVDLQGYSMTVHYTEWTEGLGINHWELYGCYMDDGDVPEESAFDSYEWTLLDSHEGYGFKPGEVTRAVFAVQTPGLYNRFRLRVYNPAQITGCTFFLSQFKLLEHYEEPTPIPEYTQVELPKFTPVTNSVKTGSRATFRAHLDVQREDSPFRLPSRRTQPKLVYRHVDEQFPPIEFVEPDSYHDVYIDGEGFLNNIFVDHRGIDFFGKDFFPKRPNHVCDILLSYDVIEKATGRLFAVNDTIPYYCKYPAPIILTEDKTIIGTGERFSTTYETIIDGVDFTGKGFCIEVECDDYDGNNFRTRRFTYDFAPTPEFLANVEKNGLTDQTLMPFGNEWFTPRSTKTLQIDDTVWWSPEGYHFVEFKLPVTLGEQHTNIRVKAIQKYEDGDATNSSDCYLTYDAITNPNEHIRITYTTGHNSTEAPHDISQWRSSNKEELEAFVSLFSEKGSAVNAKLLNDRYEAFAESNYKVLNITAPAEWGPITISHGSDKDNYSSCGTVYMEIPSNNEASTYTIQWKKVGVSKELTFTAYSLPKYLYAFRPISKGSGAEQSVSVYYEQSRNGQSSTTAIGHFGSDDTDPDCICFRTDDVIMWYSFICMRDNSTQASAYLNKNWRSNKGRDANEWASGDGVGISHVNVWWDEKSNLENMHNTCSFEPMPRTGRTGLDPLTLTLEEKPIVRMQIFDENGESSTISRDVMVKTAYIVEKEGSGIIPYGTSPTFNPFHTMEKIDATSTVNGIVEIPLPKPAEGEIIHPFIEVSYETHAGKYKYVERLISEFTDPDVFTNYIDKGLPYPVVLKTDTDDSNGYAKMWTRPVGSHFLSPERAGFTSETGTEMGYQGGKESIDVLLGSSYGLYKLGDFTGRVNVLSDGTTEHVWPLQYEYFLLAPKLAYERKKAMAHFSNESNYYKKDLIEHTELVRDSLGRQLLWPAEYTGFNSDYAIWTCTPHEVIPAMKQGQEKPNAEMVSLGYVDRSITDSDGKPLSYDEITNHDTWHDYPLNHHPLALTYNTAVEEVNPEELMNDVSEMGVPGFGGDGSVPNDPDMKKVRSGFTDFSMATPGCLPFVNLAVTHSDGEYRIRSSFELNAMDLGKPAFGAWDKLKDQRERVNDMARYLTSFQTIKSSVMGNYITDVYGQDDGIFVGFKGFSEMAVIKDYQNNTWRPYLTGFGARMEASAQFSWKYNQPPLIAKFVTRGAVSSGIMLLNPSLKDKALTEAFKDPNQHLDSLTFNPYSNHNFYLNSSFDLALTLQGGIGFDAGFIAAHGGLIGKARAVANISYVNRPYLSDGLKQSGGTRFDLSASLSAYVYFKLLFLKYSKEWPLCHVEKSYFLPDDDSNPWKSDPNLNPSLLEPSKVRYKVRPLTVTHRPTRRRVSVIGSRTISDKVDIFANPIYMNGGSRLAYFNINNPSDPNDDRVLLSGEGCSIDQSVGIYNDAVPAFTYHAASAGDHQIVAVQRLSQELQDGQDDIDAAKQLTESLQIVASVGNNTDAFRPTVVSPYNSANQAPKAAIAQNGSAAIVWASGKIDMNEYTDEESGDVYSDPVMDGNIVVAQYESRDSGGKGVWSEPVPLVSTNAVSSVRDYVIATGGRQPLVMASIPGRTESGEATAPAYLMTVGNGSARRISLGIEGAQHQLLAVYEPGETTTNHFIASCLVNAGEDGKTDVQLFDIQLNENGTIRHTSLGHLGLTDQKVLSYRLVSPKNGATGVDGLGIIWNQHEQENTDDETLDAVAFNRTYVARINRRGDYVYLSHAAQALNLDDDMMVADMTAYLDDGTDAGCPVVTAAFCIGEVQRDGASSAAEIIEKRVSLNNEILWLEDATGLSNIIDRVNGTEIKIGVRNIGLHTIRKFTVNIDGHTYEQRANLAPSQRSTITIKLPATTDFSASLPFTITADFFDIDVTDAYDAGVYTGSASTGGSFSVNVVDMCTGLALNRLDKETGKDVVAVTVSNLNPMALKAGNSVKVSLFTDPMGDTQYTSVGTYTIPASDLYDAEKGMALVRTVRFFVPAPQSRTVVYAICQTVDQDGNVVFDQNSSDNITMISLAPSNYDEPDEPESQASIGTLARLIRAVRDESKSTPDLDINGDGFVTIDDIMPLVALILESTPDRLSADDLLNPKLKAKNVGEYIEVEGLNPEKDLKVFDATGRLVNWTEPNDSTAKVKVPRKGTLIIVNDGKAGIIRH